MAHANGLALKLEFGKVHHFVCGADSGRYAWTFYRWAWALDCSGRTRAGNSLEYLGRIFGWLGIASITLHRMVVEVALGDIAVVMARRRVAP